MFIALQSVAEEGEPFENSAGSPVNKTMHKGPIMFIHTQKTFKVILATISLSAFHAGCGEDQRKEEIAELKDAQPGDQLGSTCYSYPTLFDKDTGQSLCRSPGKIFYGGFIQMPMARTATVNKCKELNMLDMGHRAGAGRSCTAECEKPSVTYCIPFTQE
jgi:hypothetical protein